jgi:transcriptional regulator with XRE-family HTH domain
MTNGHQGFDNAAFSGHLREEIARRRISRQALADLARISLSTLEKAMSGSRPFTLATVVRIEDALGTPLRSLPASPPPLAIAPGAMGSYGRQAVEWIEGDYLTLRPSFAEDTAVYAYRTTIEWDPAAGHLVFRESERIDSAFAQSGYVSMPNLSGHTYLVTSESGQYRLIILGRATRDKRMYGLLSTLQVGAGSQLVPVACPIAFVPLDQLDAPDFGIARQGEPWTENYRAILGQALDNDFCRLRG